MLQNMEHITTYFTTRHNTKLILHLIVYITFTIIYSNLPDDDFIINSDLSKQYNRLYFSAITHTTIESARLNWNQQLRHNKF